MHLVGSAGRLCSLYPGGPSRLGSSHAVGRPHGSPPHASPLCRLCSRILEVVVVAVAGVVVVVVVVVVVAAAAAVVPYSSY